MTCDNLGLINGDVAQLPDYVSGKRIFAPSMNYSISVIRSESEFQALQAPWARLVARAVDGSTFLTHDWLYSWWTSYRPDARLSIVVARAAGEVVGIAPMMLLREGHLGRIFRRLRFIGDGTSETDHMSFIIDAEHADGVLRQLLIGVEALSWDIAHFNQMPEQSRNTLALLEFASERGWLVSTAPVPCPIRVLPASYDELLKSLPSRLRTAIRSARRQLAERHQVEFGQLQRPDELAPALAALYRNHASRWQARGEEGVFVDSRKRNFYSALGARLLATDALRFFHLKLDGHIVAQQFCFEYNGRVMLLQEGFDYAYAKQNVGNVLRAMVFEALIQRGGRTYDFLAGMSRHKQSWANEVVNDLDVRACRPSLLGHAAFHIQRLLRRAEALKNSRELVPAE
jgi:CelD/BcsL family acetyltransferase involved in cellulose biosynthesis